MSSPSPNQAASSPVAPQTLLIEEELGAGAIEVDNNDGDSAYAPTLVTDTTSLRSSIMHYKWEYGRRFHALDDGTYWAANDERQQNAEDLVHEMYRNILDEELTLAPIPDNIQKVLDIGCGTGIWAIDFADLHPSAEVIGVDLSPIQPAWVPPNCKFEIDNINRDWTYAKNSFEFIHIRAMTGCVPNWVQFHRKALEHLVPGGWVEQVEISCLVQSDDGSLLPDAALVRWGQIFGQVGEKMGNSFRACELAADAIKDAGFVNVQERRIKLPIGTWPKDVKLKSWGAWNRMFLLQALEGFAVRGLTSMLGWSIEEVQLYLVEVRKELNDPKIHSYIDMCVVIGQKPTAEKSLIATVTIEMIRTGPTTPIVIALMGIGGAERERFLEALVDTTLSTSCTETSVSSVSRIAKGMIDGEKVWLVDTPATVSDDEMVEAVRTALGHELQQEDITVHGLICIQDINEICMHDTAEENVTVFKKLLAPTLGSNVMIVTALWDELRSAVQGFRAEFALKAIYSSSYPAVTVNRVEDSRDDDVGDIYLGMIQSLIVKMKSTEDDQESAAKPRTSPATLQLHRIIDKKDNDLASLRAEIGVLKDKFDGQSEVLLKLSHEKECLLDKLEQAEKQVQQLKVQLEEQESKLFVETNVMREQFDAKWKAVEARLHESERDRDSLTRQMDLLSLDVSSRQEETEEEQEQQEQTQSKQRELNPSLNVLDSRGEFELYRAAAGGHYNQVKELLEQGADACMCTNFQWTALHWASSNGHPKVVELLLSYGASPNATSDSGQKPLGMARTDEIREILLKYGATE
ncbi:sam dependent methyltransferase [Grosmannia clavigera kw1407]|uniref:Sam dependent methyltransferase n=1 Tax=Grosmannia clavigera (strain kw1407 / UAMH 11150) TaxID=655863 RepID=F0XU79_GROCL|nr:sam dependent methyltransferase [Grosmannia clavigera kw1407]EFW98908.1 sam dependent methyltransferase [Grosmannia clavigera kw1407]